MPQSSPHRPFPIFLLAGFQFLKGGFLLLVTLCFVLIPGYLPHSQGFSQMLYIADHGKSLSGFLVPAFGLYMLYVGLGLLRLRPRVRRNLAISSALTIALSLQRLGLFGESEVTSSFDQQSLYILILFDLAVYLYLAFHPEITYTFQRVARQR